MPEPFESDNKTSVFDVAEECAKLPADTESMLADIYFTDRPSASSRVFRINREVPLHYHVECNEHLYS